jgi:hypothetical protein
MTECQQILFGSSMGMIAAMLLLGALCVIWQLLKCTIWLVFVAPIYGYYFWQMCRAERRLARR